MLSMENIIVKNFLQIFHSADKFFHTLVEHYVKFALH